VAETDSCLIERAEECEYNPIVEAALCSISPAYFLENYAWIQNKAGTEELRWQPWDYQLKLLSEIQTWKRIRILKARQLGITWLIAGYAEWMVLFKKHARVLFLSANQDTARDILAKAKFIHTHLPDFLQLPLKHPDSQDVLDFIGSYSHVRVMPSTEGAGKGTDATLVVRDELAEHPEADANFRAIMPTIDAGEGKSIDLSTIKKSDINNHFSRIVRRVYNAAKPPVTMMPKYGKWFERYDSIKGNIKLFFLGWRLRPVRTKGMTLDQWFEEEVVPSYDNKWEIEENYPETIDQALSSPETTCRFDVKAIKQLRSRCVEPLWDERNGVARFYTDAMPGARYILSIDTSDAGEDPTAGGVIDGANLQRVAGFHGKLPPYEVAVIAKDLWERYDQPFVVIDRRDPSGAGRAVIEKLMEMGVTNQYCYKEDTPGWVTTGVNRPVMISELAEAIRLKQIIEPDENVLNEFLSFIKTERKPEGEAIKGCHDDWTMMWAMAIQVRKLAPLGKLEIKTFIPKQRW
jgi:hypothetical protein